MQGKLFEYIEKNFEKPLTLFFGIVLILFSLIPIDSLLDDLVLKIMTRYLCYLFFIILWVIYWLIKRKWLPRNSKKHVGLIISIVTKNDRQKDRLKNDFIRRINEIIQKHNLDQIINLIYLNEKQSEYINPILDGYSKFRIRASKNPKLSEITDKDLLRFQKTQKRINGHFYVWGNIKERKDEQNKFFLNLEGLVLHDPLDQKTHISLKQEFQNIWHRSIEFQEKVEFKGFLLSADLIFIAVEYIAGLAALYSGNTFIAVKLHENVEHFIDEIKDPTPNIVNVGKSLKSLIPQEYFLIAQVYNNLGNVNETEKYLKLIFKREEYNYSGLLLKSIVEFSNHRDPNKSLATIQLAKKHAKNDGTWRYNEGFILMYLERFEKAFKVYKKISDSTYINELIVVGGVIGFNLKLIEKEPDYVQSYFILGYLFYKKLNNIPEAYLYFENYLRKSNNPKFEYLNKKVNSYFAELEQRMELN